MADQDDNHRAYHDKRGKYRGTVRVPLRNLSFAEVPGRHIFRTRSKENIERLARIFETSCDQLEPENRIPADIGSVNAFDHVLRFSNLTRERIMDYLKVPPEILKTTVKFRCFRGYHRVQAALIALDEVDQWWAVDFYEGREPRTFFTESQLI